MSEEEAFRALLDPSGVLRPGALASPDRAGAFAVFSQQPDAKLDVEAIKRQASRFFAAKIGVTVDKRYGELPVEVDAARVVLASDDGTASGTRMIYGRRTQPDDLAAAESAERAQGTAGLALLAQRCPTIWLVVAEAPEDRAALTIAAILASTMLGPILTPDGGALLGVRSARLALEGRPRPYR